MRRVVPYVAVVAVVAGLLWAFGGDDATEAPPDEAPRAATAAPSKRARRAPPRPAPEEPNPDTTGEPRRVVDDEGWDPGAPNPPPEPVTVFPPNRSGITAALDQIAPDLHDCWAGVRERDPDIPPILTVTFTLQPPPDPSSRRAVVDEIGLAEGSSEDPELLACVQNHLLNLPVAPPVGDPVQMTFPFAFGDPDDYEAPVDAGN